MRHPQPVAWAVSRWCADPWSRGAWTGLLVGGTGADRARLAAPVSDRLVLAGEGVHPTRPAMLHGAYESGLTAAWLQQYADNSLAAEARRWGLPTVATDFTDPLTLSAAGPVHGATEALAALAGTARTLTAATDRPVADVIAAHAADLDEPARRTLAYAVEAGLVLESGLDLRLASARGTFGEPGVGEGDRWLPGGLDAVVARLAAGLEIALHRPVTGLRHDRDGVTVSGPWGALHADRAVLADLAADLPDGHRAALARIGTGRAEKVLLRYPERFWPVSPGGYLWWGEDTDTWCEWADLTDGLGQPVLALLAAGDAASALHSPARTDAEIVAQAHATVTRMASTFPNIP